MSKLEENLKTGVYLLTVVVPLVEAIGGAIRAVRDGIRRVRGQKTSIQIAVEKHVQEQAQKVFEEMRLQAQEQLEKGEALLRDQILRGDR